MPIRDYNGIEGFAVDAKNAQDVYEAIDRMHTQLLDEMNETAEIIARRSPAIAEKKIAMLETAQHILEEAMDKLLDMEGVKA